MLQCCCLARVSWDEYCSKLCVFGVNGSKQDPTGRFQQTLVGGAVALPVAKVGIMASHLGRGIRTTAIVGRVDGSMKSTLHQQEAIGLFGSVLPVCVSGSEVHVVARNDIGRAVAAARGRSVVPHSCSPTIPAPPG